MLPRNFASKKEPSRANHFGPNWISYGGGSCHIHLLWRENPNGSDHLQRTSSGSVGIGHVISREKDQYHDLQERNLQSTKMKRFDGIRLFLLSLLSLKTKSDFLTFYAVHPGERYGNASRSAPTRHMGDCSILCSSQRSTPCKAYNYRSSDGSCELITIGKSSLIPSKGYQAYVQSQSFNCSCFRLDRILPRFVSSF